MNKARASLAIKQSPRQQTLRMLTRAYTRHFPVRKGKGWLIHRLLRHSVTEGADSILTTVGSGYVMQLDLRDLVQRTIYFFDFYEGPLARWVMELLTSGTIFCDVGAHVGQYTLLAAQAVGAEGHVYAFEPEPRNFHALQRNVHLNALQNVQLYHAAVADSAGERSFFTHTAQTPAMTNWGVHSFRPELSGFDLIEKSVAVVTLDDVLCSQGILAPEADGAVIAGSARATGVPKLVIKMDVQGAELLAVRGASRTLACLDCTIVLEAEERHAQRFGYSTPDLKRYLASQGFALYRVDMSGKRARLLPADVATVEHDSMLVARKPSAHRAVDATTVS